MNARKRINSFLIKNRQWFIIGGAIVLIVPLVILLLWNRENVEQMTPKEETYRYVAGVKIEYTDEMQLVREEDKTVIKESDEVDSGSVPIFSSMSYKIILPASMGPPDTKIVGILSLAAAISNPGTFLSQFGMQTNASN